MTDVSKQFSMREIVGSVAPGAMVIFSALYVASQIPGLDIRWNQVGATWSALLIGFVLSYGIGTMLKSGTEFAFDRVTQMGAPRPAEVDAPHSLRGGWAARATGVVDPLIRRAALYLGGGHDITASNREFRDSWHDRAVPEHVVSAHVFHAAAAHYRALFDTEPSGEESLAMCEYYIRERMPGAMQEIEENAARALLMGNLIIPTLCWLCAVLIGIIVSVFKFASLLVASVLSWALLLGIVTQIIGLLLLVLVFPYFVDMIGKQWAETSRNRIKLVLVAFTIACRLSRNADAEAQAA
jgi:hypothetical protein